MAVNRIGVDAASGKGHLRNLPPTGQPDVLRAKFIKGKSRITLFLLVFAAILLGGCSGGSGGDSTPGAEAPASAVAGAGVKGPLAWAVVNLYQVDLSATDLKGSLLDQGNTDAAAAIQGLALPAGTSGLVLVEVVADADTIDITSGAYPVLDTLYTVVDAQRIIDGEAVYATPLTTMAVKLARAKADTGAPYCGDGNDTITLAEFTAALALAQAQVKATLGFGLDSSVDIFDVPPLLTDDTDTAAEQEQVVRYRQAIEALAAVVQQVADDSSASDTPQQIFEALIDDLADGEIDGENSGVPVAALAALDTPIDTTLAGLDLNALTIPGTTTPVSDIEDQLAAEVEQTGAAVDTTDLENDAVSADLDPPVLVADSDGDGVRDDLDAFPLDPAETADTDSDGVGDNSDAFPNDPTETVDSDSDGVGDNADVFPSDPTEWLDSDADGVGDNGDAFPNDPTEWIDTDNDGIGDNSDPDPLTPATVLTLDAVSEPGRVTLTWSETSAAANLSIATVANVTRMAAATKTYNLYYATEPDCDVSNYASCEGGTKVADVASPYVVDNLVNGVNYWFKVEAEEGGDKAVSEDEGARPDRAIADGEVYAIAQDAVGVTYLGGTFTRVGMRASYGVTMDAIEGHLGAYPMVNDVVQAAVSDGSGGFYVGGAFTDVGGSAHNHLVHILASGALDDTWNPDVDGTVYALYLSGNTLYVGGEFSSIDDGRGAQTRNNLAALDTSGTLDDTWNPNVGGGVYAIAVDGDTVYVGGSFGTVGGEGRGNLAAIGTNGDLSSSWSPSTNSYVRALGIANGVVYAGGSFTQVNGVAHNKIAAIGTDGTLSDWDPNLNGGLGGQVRSLAVSGNNVYIGGTFVSAFGVGRYNLAAFNAGGSLGDWAPAFNNIGVNVVTASGNTVYVGGALPGTGYNFDFFAAYDTDGNRSSWNPNLKSNIYAIAISDGTVYAGGEFNITNDESRNHLAAINADGSVGSWDPSADGAVLELAVQGSTVYAGGDFTKIGDTTRNNLAAIDTAGNLSDTWNPNANDRVTSLAIDNDTVYVGGDFTTIGGTGRSHVAAIGTNGNLSDTWNPGANDVVDALTVSGSTVYAGGWFDTFGGATRKGLAAVSTTDGTLADWAPTVNTYPYITQHQVTSIVVSGSTVFVGGEFYSIGDEGVNEEYRYGLAAIGTDGTFSSWYPGPGEVDALALSGTTLYAGGYFDYAGTQTRHNLAAFDITTIDTTDEPTAWDQGVNSWVNALLVTDDAVYAGGHFTRVNDALSPYVAILAP